MPLDQSLYTNERKLHDESRFEYLEGSWTVPIRLTHSDHVDDLRQADEEMLAKTRQTLPGDSNEWCPDYILISGSPVGSNNPPLTHTFVFKRLRRRP